MKCPCIKCICLAVCRLKSFSNLFDDCDLLGQYYDDTKHSDISSPPHYNRIAIRDALNPTRWEIDNAGYFTRQDTYT